MPELLPFSEDALGLDPGPLSPTEVFDEADQAQHLHLQEIAEVQRRARTLNRPEIHVNFNGEDCVVCGDPIPRARLAMHKVRCTDCQAALEDANELRRRHFAAP